MREAQARCDGAEFGEWKAFYEIEPWGDPIDDLRMGRVCATIANYSGHVTSAKSPRDFMFRFGEGPAKPMTADQIRTVVGTINGAVASRNQCLVKRR